MADAPGEPSGQPSASTIAILSVVGAGCALLPRLSKDSAVKVVLVVLLVLCLAAAFQLASRRGAPAAAAAAEAAAAEEPASRTSKKAKAAKEAGAEGAAAAGDSATVLKANGEGPASAQGTTARRRAKPVEEEEEEVDPVWDTDWTNIRRDQMPKQQLPQLPTEIFELNDTPTWLARLQQRREQAERAGKVKLVQKIDKEIADAKKQEAASAASLAAAHARKCAQQANGKVDSYDMSADVRGGDPDDIWDMDWAKWSPQGPAPEPAACAA